jgi:hypothetical protein
MVVLPSIVIPRRKNNARWSGRPSSIMVANAISCSIRTDPRIVSWPDLPAVVHYCHETNRSVRTSKYIFGQDL